MSNVAASKKQEAILLRKRIDVRKRSVPQRKVVTEEDGPSVMSLLFE